MGLLIEARQVLVMHLAGVASRAATLDPNSCSVLNNSLLQCIHAKILDGRRRMWVRDV